MLIISLSASAQTNWRENTLHYIRGLAREDGGYGWADQPDAHLTPTFAVIGILHTLEALPHNKAALVEYVRTHHPQNGVHPVAGPSGTEMRNLDYQQIQSLIWLGADASEFTQKVRGWRSQQGKTANFEKQGYPVFFQEMMTPVCRDLLGISLSDIATELKIYLQSRRRENGSFNNAPAEEGGDGNILNTYWGLYALGRLAEREELQEETIQWIQECQRRSGGFTHQPDPQIGANDDVAYTWAAVKALALLSAQPADREACIRYLLSLRNADGGFGKQPGMPSSPISTFYALEALNTLETLSVLDTVQAHRTIEEEPNFSGLQVFSVQFQAPGTGSPAEAVMLADSLGIQLWGAKNASEGWVEAAQAIANARQVPVTFFHAPEDYGRYIHVAGMGGFSHISDPIFPAGSDFAYSIQDDQSWQKYEENFVRPLRQVNGGVLLQITNNEPLARILLDEAVEKRVYQGISTIHFAQNFLFFLPHLYQYRHQLPFVALQDAHGTESWWWAGELTGYRTLFLAREPTYEGMMNALRNNWVVAVRHDSVSYEQTRLLGGAPGVQSWVLSHQEQWQWWDEETQATARPWAAITILRPRDTLEVAHPAEGVTIRIRCRWDGNRQLLKSPRVTLEQLKVDGEEVDPGYREEKSQRGQITDAYYSFTLQSPSSGKHVIELRLRDRKTKAVEVMRHQFTIRP